MADRKELLARILALRDSVAALDKEIVASKLFKKEVSDYLRVATTQLNNAHGTAL